MSSASVASVVKCVSSYVLQVRYKLHISSASVAEYVKCVNSCLCLMPVAAYVRYVSSCVCHVRQ